MAWSWTDHAAWACGQDQVPWAPLSVHASAAGLPHGLQRSLLQRVMPAGGVDMHHERPARRLCQFGEELDHPLQHSERCGLGVH